jgi:predicted dehydrogenase
VKKINIAILGVGRWGVHLLRNFLQHPQANVVAVVDPHFERLEWCKKQFSLLSNVVLSLDWSAVRELSEINAVAIATPASTHYNLIADALQQGYHVLAEKPLTVNPAEALELCHLAQQQRLQLLVDHTYLFHPAIEKGKKFIESGRLGELRYGYASRTNLGPVRQDVDALWDLAIHDIAIFNNWLGETPVQVQANGSVWLQGAGAQKTRGDNLADLVWITLTYPSGFQAFIHVCWLNPDKQRRLSIVGSQGTLIFDEMSSATPLIFQQGKFEQEGDRFIPTDLNNEIIEVDNEEPLRRVCDRFLNSINPYTPSSLNSAWVGAELVHILTCLSQSLQQGGSAIAVPQLIQSSKHQQLL